MKYASTLMNNGNETIVVVLPLSSVPGFNPDFPPQENTYTVSDDVQVGWIKSGGGFVPPPVISDVPQKVTRRQFKIKLHLMGIMGEVESIISAANDPILTINWEEALDFERNNPFVSQMAIALNKSDAEIDQFFIEAKQL